MVRKVDAAKLQNLNLKVKTLDLKPYTDKWKPEAVTSEIKKNENIRNPRTVLPNSALPISKHVKRS